MMRAKRALTHRVLGLGLKTTVLTMPPFSMAKGLCFFSRRKYGASKPSVWKVERTRRINVFIERAVRWSVFGYKVGGQRMFPNMSAAHDVLTTHLMHPLMSYPYI